MQPRRAYEVPLDTETALQLATRHHPSAFLAGGTSKRLRRPPPDLLVIDVSKLGLDAIHVGPQTLRVGATATLNRVLEQVVLRQVGNGILAEALEASGAPVWRNHATLGGRLMDANVDDALGAALTVLDARAVWQSASGAPPEARALEFVAGAPAGLLHAVEIVGREAWRFALESLRRATYDAPCVSVAVGMRAEAGRVAEVRVASSGVGLRLRRAERTEAALTGSAWPQESFKAAQEALVGEIRPHNDARATAVFRTQAARVLLGRALRRVATSDGEET